MPTQKISSDTTDKADAMQKKELRELHSIRVQLAELKDISKNSHFFVRARKCRLESRSLRGVNEDSRAEMTPLSREKCIFKDALKALIKAQAKP